MSIINKIVFFFTIFKGKNKYMSKTTVDDVSKNKGKSQFIYNEE